MGCLALCERRFAVRDTDCLRLGTAIVLPKNTSCPKTTDAEQPRLENRHLPVFEQGVPRQRRVCYRKSDLNVKDQSLRGLQNNSHRLAALGIAIAPATKRSFEIGRPQAELGNKSVSRSHSYFSIAALKNPRISIQAAQRAGQVDKTGSFAAKPIP
jgi:hypothetical protein